MPETDNRPLTQLDAERDWLREKYPNWQIWYVPQTGPHGRSVLWCAQPKPLLHGHSQEELVEYIEAASRSIPTMVEEAR